MINTNKKKIIAILKILNESKKPIGGTSIARAIKRYGIYLSQRTVRYYLALTDKAGLTKNLGKQGRIITKKGIEELDRSFVIDKIGLIAAKIDEMSYKMNFSLNNLKGNVIVNISTIANKDFNKAKQLIKMVFKKKFGMGQYLIICKSGTQIGDFLVDEGKTAIATICSVTINGIFLNAGIPVNSRFGGLVEIRDGMPVRFTEIINYDGSTLDPLEIFIKGGMTKVKDAVSKGMGIVGASFREIPSIAILEAKRIRRKLESVGLNGIFMIGDPGQPLLDIPVAEGKAGIIVFGGLNPIAIVEENHIKTQNLAMSTLINFNELTNVAKL